MHPAHMPLSLSSLLFGSPHVCRYFFQLGSIPAYSDLTLSGVLANSGHGSGYQTTSDLWTVVQEIVWVDGCGEVRRQAAQQPYHGTSAHRN